MPCSSRTEAASFARSENRYGVSVLLEPPTPGISKITLGIPTRCMAWVKGTTSSMLAPMPLNNSRGRRGSATDVVPTRIERPSTEIVLICMCQPMNEGVQTLDRHALCRSRRIQRDIRASGHPHPSPRRGTGPAPGKPRKIATADRDLRNARSCRSQVSGASSRGLTLGPHFGASLRGRAERARGEARASRPPTARCCRRPSTAFFACRSWVSARSGR